MTMDRRQFVKKSAVSLALGALGSTLFDLFLPRAAHAFDAQSLSMPLPLGVPILVVVDLLGGNDILNTHVPYSVPGVSNHYFADRPGTSIKTVTAARPYVAPTGSVSLMPALDLDGQYALHPALPWLANRWWERGDVAIVQGVGESVAVERSHFAARAFRDAAAFTGPRLASGWLGRYNDLRNQDQVLASISLSGLHRSLAGMATPILGVSDVGSFDWRVKSNVPSRSQFTAALMAMGAAGAPPELNKVSVAARAIQRVGSAAGMLKPTAQPALNAGLPGGSLPYQLAQAAMMIAAGVPCQTYAASLSGFDLHGAAAYNHYALLGQVNLALQRFFDVIDAGPRAQDVFVLLTSEFGRVVKENAGMGTDHGRASSAFLIGAGVQGGLHGEMPSMVARDYDALIPTVDFRALFTTVLNRLGGDAAISREVLGQDESGNDFADLGVFA